MTANQQVK